MERINRGGIAFVTVALALASNCSQTADAETRQPKLQKGVVGIQLRERGAFLIETFDSGTVDEKKWRIWHSDPKAVKFFVQDGRFEMQGEGHLQHNGLWSLNAVKFKNVTLVGRMNVQSTGSHPHDLLLHLCGGDMPTSPDHWVEISMRDIGDGKARFSVFAAVEKGGFTERHKEVVLELRTAAGKTHISRVQSPNFAHYMLPLDYEGWDVFPVGAVIRVSCDGKSLGEAEISLNGLDGLYPDDVYDVFME